MIKTFSQYVNENLTSIVDRYKNKRGIRKEDEITDEFVRSFMNPLCKDKGDISIEVRDGEQYVNIDGNFFIDYYYDEDELPFKFGKVTGNFSIEDCGLGTLKGCPETVGGNFTCDRNKKLKNLEGGPKYVGGLYTCAECSLESLKGCAQDIGGGFNCNNNNLTSLEEGPKKIGGAYTCLFNAKEFDKEYVESICKCEKGCFTKIEYSHKK